METVRDFPRERPIDAMHCSMDANKHVLGGTSHLFLLVFVKLTMVID